MHQFAGPIDQREAEEVVRLASSQAHGPSVEELAQALGLPTQEVERLLAQVRTRRAERRRFWDRSAALSAALALAMVAGGVGALALWPRPRPAPVPDFPFVVSGPGLDDAAMEDQRAALERAQASQERALAEMEREMARAEAERDAAAGMGPARG